MSVPEGVSLPTMKSMNGPSPRMAAINNQLASANYQNNLINATGGRSRRRGRGRGRTYKGGCGCGKTYKGGCGRGRTYKGGFLYPQNKPLYQEVGGNGQNTVDVTNKLVEIQSQNNENGVFDKKAQQGGRSRRRRTRGRGRRQRHRTRGRGRR